jgi:hypothetical protein
MYRYERTLDVISYFPTRGLSRRLDRSGSARGPGRARWLQKRKQKKPLANSRGKTPRAATAGCLYGSLPVDVPVRWADTAGRGTRHNGKRRIWQEQKASNQQTSFSFSKTKEQSPSKDKDYFSSRYPILVTLSRNHYKEALESHYINGAFLPVQFPFSCCSPRVTTQSYFDSHAFHNCAHQYTSTHRLSNCPLTVISVKK